jgi:hypothetical protein
MKLFKLILIFFITFQIYAINDLVIFYIGMSQSQVESILNKNKIDFTTIIDGNSMHFEFFEYKNKFLIFKRLSFLNNELVDQCWMCKYGPGTNFPMVIRKFFFYHVNFDYGKNYKKWKIKINDKFYILCINIETNMIEEIKEEI